MSSLPISPQLFAILSGLVEEKLGLHYDAQDAALLADKLTPRALDRGFDSLLEYYYFLRYDAGAASELDALADALVVNETYFFREADQLRVLVDILAETEGQRRIWCAASSTGEEPYTLAMMLEERGILPRVDILASDVSVRALGRAREGIYRGRAFRSLPSDARARWFVRADPSKDEVMQVVPAIRSAVRFRQINLLDDETIATLGSFDAVLCRNVLIYFRDELVRDVIARLAGRLVRGGHLLVGASESLLRLGTSLTCVERGGVFLYRRDEA
jgi:chemotaxis protein methyltransferase CheR